MKHFIGALLVCLSFSIQAAPLTIDFEDLSDDGFVSVIESGGFVFSSNGSPDPLLATTSAIDGDFSLAWCPFLCEVAMETANGSTFSLFSFDTYGVGYESGPLFFDVLGYRADGSTVTETFPGATSQQSISLQGNWTDLTRVEFSPQYSAVFGYVIDNIEVSVVPIPAAAWLFGSALMALGWARKRVGP